MNLNGIRNRTRLTVTRTGGRIQAWVGTNLAGAPVIDFTDADPLPAGNVGLMTVGMPAIVFDNVFLADSPTCSDGMWNGDEEGVDCGGSCPAACVYPFDWAWDFTGQGHAGWWHETYGTDPVSQLERKGTTERPLVKDTHTHTHTSPLTSPVPFTPFPACAL